MFGGFGEGRGMYDERQEALLLDAVVWRSQCASADPIVGRGMSPHPPPVGGDKALCSGESYPDDDLAPAKGVCTAVVLSGFLWLILVGIPIWGL